MIEAVRSYVVVSEPPNTQFSTSTTPARGVRFVQSVKDALDGVFGVKLKLSVEAVAAVTGLFCQSEIETTGIVENDVPEAASTGCVVNVKEDAT